MIDVDKKNWFRTLCSKNGLAPTDEQLEQLAFYVVLLLDWNKKINIISRKDEENVWTFHILHSISLLFKLEINKNSSIVDIGTGGGLPSVPLKILRPDLTFLCVDSTGKKIKALAQMIQEIGLKNIHAVWGRAEETGMLPEFKGKYDIAVARAVSSLTDVLSWAKPFLKNRKQKEGTSNKNDTNHAQIYESNLLVFKGGDLSKEIETARRRHPSIDVQSIDLTFNGSEQIIASDKKILVVHF